MPDGFRRPGAKPGSYALILSTSTEAVIRVGRLGNLQLQPGFYVYVGSALGPEVSVPELFNNEFFSSA